MASFFARCFIVVVSVFSVTSSVAETIYRCRAYNGESFWAKNHCNSHKSLVEGIYTVPDNMPFQQQVDLAQQGLSRAINIKAAENEERTRATQCESINHQLRQLEAKYTSWQYVPIDQVNADQSRERDLKARRAALRCYQ